MVFSRRARRCFAFRSIFAMAPSCLIPDTGPASTWRTSSATWSSPWYARRARRAYQGLDQVALDVRHVEAGPVSGIKHDGAIAKMERNAKQRRARLEKTIHFARVVDVLCRNACLHPA